MIQILPDKKQKCCGCSACAQICPKGCIKMTEDDEGFQYPLIDIEKCVGCNLCEQVCPVAEEKNCQSQSEKEKPIAIGGWHRDEAIRFESSSGGAFTLFAESILEQGGIVYGCTLKEDFYAEHIRVECREELKKLRGSKYIQSDIGDVYKEIKEKLCKGLKILFVGTPCQCAGLHRYIRTGKILEDKEIKNLITCDFICHGVPSPKVFKSYIKYLEEKYQDKLISFRFRNKDKGWNSSGLQMGTELSFRNIEKERFFPAFRDTYMNGFLDDLYLRPSCYQCEFKSLPKQYSDITIADFWGVKKVDPELYDGKGTSLILLHSEHGQELFDSVKEDFFYKEVDYKAAIRKNKSLVKSAADNPRRAQFFSEYENKPFEKVMKKYMNAFSWASHKVMKIIWNLLEAIVRGILTPVLKLFHQSWDAAMWENFFQFVKFSLVGLSNVVVSYTINISVLFILRGFELQFDYVIANITAFLLSVLWSFHWNSRYVFEPGRESRNWRLRALFKTYISYAFSGIILNNVLATLWIRVLGISKYISPFLNLPFTMPVNFFMQKLWAYRKRESNHEK